MIGLLISWIIVGGVAGWLAEKVMKTADLNLKQDIMLGIGGSMFGGLLAWIFGIRSNGFVGSVVIALAGACFLIWIVRKRK